MLLYCPKCDSTRCHFTNWERDAECEDCGHTDISTSFFNPLSYKERRLRDNPPAEVKVEKPKQEVDYDYVPDYCTCNVNPECAPCAYCTEHSRMIMEG